MSQEPHAERLLDDALEIIGRLTAERDALLEAVALLDRVEVGESGGWPLANIDLFLPGPLYYEWAEAVRANRRARRPLTPSTEP